MISHVTLTVRIPLDGPPSFGFGFGLPEDPGLAEQLASKAGVVLGGLTGGNYTEEVLGSLAGRTRSAGFAASVIHKTIFYKQLLGVMARRSEPVVCPTQAFLGGGS